MIIGNYLQELFFSSSLIVDYVVLYFVFVLWLFFCVSNGVAHFFSNCTVEFYPPPRSHGEHRVFFLNTLICLEFSEVACAPLRARSKLAERKVIYALFRMALCVLLGASATFVDSSENKRKSKALCSPWLRGGLKTTSSFCFSLL